MKGTFSEVGFKHALLLLLALGGTNSTETAKTRHPNEQIHLN